MKAIVETAPAKGDYLLDRAIEYINESKSGEVAPIFSDVKIQKAIFLLALHCVRRRLNG